MRKAGEQLNAVLAELEHVRADGRQKLEAKEREIQHLEGALAAAEGDRQKAAARVAAVEAEMTQLDARVRLFTRAATPVGFYNVHLIRLD